MFCVLAVLTALALIRLPAAPPAAPTPEQLQLVGKLTGVGHIKFGMAPADFTSGDLIAATNARDNQPGMKYYTDSDLDGITWGRLPPDRVQLGFYYDHLVDIQLHFTQPFGDLLAVTHAAFEKYGTPPWNSYLFVEDNAAPTPAAHWTGVDNDNIATVEMLLAFPHEVPAGSDETTLAQKITGMLEFHAPNLYYELRQDHIKDLEQQTLKAHDLDKIKADL